MAPAAVVARIPGREQVLVVPRSRALPQGSWHGLRRGGVRELLRAISVWGEFRPRSEVESAPDWQQVIPHMVVVGDGGLLVMRRLGGGSERRLRGQVTLGVGGHINAGDGSPAEAWLAGCRREWAEEVVCDRDLAGQPLGLLKDDSGAVGQVHLGVLILVRAGAARLELREDHKLKGVMEPLLQLDSYYLEMETWSQFAYDALLKGDLTEPGEKGLEVPLPAGGENPLQRW
jgi:predicted NUDIX family phosphoesterase